MNQIKLEEVIDKSIRELGEEKVKQILVNELKQKKPNEYTLTIIANQSMHNIPPRFIHGETYVASSGNINFSSQEIIVSEYKKILLKLRDKLTEKEWKNIYLVPTGHTTLAMQIKLLIYHILRINTIDLFYSKGEYHELEIEYRKFMI